MHCLEVIISMNNRAAKEQLARKSENSKGEGRHHEKSTTNPKSKRPKSKSIIPNRQIRIRQNIRLLSL